MAEGGARGHGQEGERFRFVLNAEDTVTARYIGRMSLTFRGSCRRKLVATIHMSRARKGVVCGHCAKTSGA